MIYVDPDFHTEEHNWTMPMGKERKYFESESNVQFYQNPNYFISFKSLFVLSRMSTVDRDRIAFTLMKIGCETRQKVN